MVDGLGMGRIVYYSVILLNYGTRDESVGLFPVCRIPQCLLYLSTDHIIHTQRVAYVVSSFRPIPTRWLATY